MRVRHVCGRHAAVGAVPRADGLHTRGGRSRLPARPLMEASVEQVMWEATLIERADTIGRRMCSRSPANLPPSLSSFKRCGRRCL